jgi:hypothetical protein
MSNVEQDLASFNNFALRRLELGPTEQTIDDLFDQWRAENPSPELHAEDVAAIAASINDFRNGERGQPVGIHSAEMRREFGLADE